MTFLLILIIAVILPEIFHRFKITHLPFYILAGIIIGPEVLGFHPGEALTFMADIGLYLLIFLAGLEVFETRDRGFKGAIVFSLLMGVVSLVGGFILGVLAGYGTLASILWGLILMSSSVGECIPLINSCGFLKKKLGHILIPGVVILDGGALIGLGLLVAYKRASGLMEFLVSFFLIFLLLVFAFLILPRIIRPFFKRRGRRKTRESDLKFILLVLVFVIIISELVGVHGIVPAFIVGVIMGEFVTSQVLYEKIHGLGHGLFIPLFFVVIGMKLDLGIFKEGSMDLIFTIALISTLLTTKVLGGILYSIIERFGIRAGFLIGVTYWPVLSASIAATVIGLEAGIFEESSLFAVVMMAIASTLITPLVQRTVSKDIQCSVKMEDHTVIIGHGRTSSRIVSILEMTGMKFIVIDCNMGKIEKLEKRNVQTVYGNAADPDTLKDASIERARVALITIPEGHDTFIIARHIRKVNRRCYIVAKVHTEHDHVRLTKEHLADTILWPEKLSARIASDIVFEKAT